MRRGPWGLTCSWNQPQLAFRGTAVFWHIHIGFIFQLKWLSFVLTSLHLKCIWSMIYITCDCEFPKTEDFFSPLPIESVFWSFLPCCSFGLLCFSLPSTQNPDPDNHQASCHSSSLWNVWKPPADFTRKQFKKQYIERGGGWGGWYSFVCDFLASTQMDCS